LSDVDWIKIKIDYESNNTSYRKIAIKYGVGFPALQRVAKRDNWVKCKKETQDKIETKVRQKTVSKIAEKISDRNARILDISDMATDAIEEYLREKHYKQHVIKYKYYDCEGKPNKEELQAVELLVADTKALSNIIASLDKIQKGQRLAEGVDNPSEQTNTNQLDDLVKIMAMGGVKRE
jgi:hypothetical protein